MKAFEEDIFYLRSLTRFENQAVWFTSVPVGKNKLQTIIPAMCKKANIQGHKTNHSLRATGATELYMAGVPEKIIKERTGHRSFESLRMYEKTNTSQHKAVCNILTSKKDTIFNSFNSEMAKPDSSRVDSVVQNTSTLSNSVPAAMSFKDCQVLEFCPVFAVQALHWECRSFQTPPTRKGILPAGTKPEREAIP